MLPVFTKLVVVLAPRGIANDLVRFVDFFEFFLGAGIVRVYIGMKLARLPSVSRLDVFVGGVFVDSEHVVVVLGHYFFDVPAVRRGALSD